MKIGRSLKLFFSAALITILSSGINLCQNNSPKDVVDIGVKKGGPVAAGESFTVEVNLDIKDGWHINANKPFDDYLSPTVISIKDTSEAEVLKVKYPAPLIKKLSFSSSDLALYENTVEITLEMKVRKGVKAQKLELKGELQYQPCNDQTCLFPVSKEFTITIPLKKKK